MQEANLNPVNPMMMGYSAPARCMGVRLAPQAGMRGGVQQICGPVVTPTRGRGVVDLLAAGVRRGQDASSVREGSADNGSTCMGPNPASLAQVSYAAIGWTAPLDVRRRRPSAYRLIERCVAGSRDVSTSMIATNPPGAGLSAIAVASARLASHRKGGKRWRVAPGRTPLGVVRT